MDGYGMPFEESWCLPSSSGGEWDDSSEVAGAEVLEVEDEEEDEEEEGLIITPFLFDESDEDSLDGISS